MTSSGLGVVALVVSALVAGTAGCSGGSGNGSRGVSNTAVDGSTAGMLDLEITQALAKVPRPRLVIVEDIGNDITCDGRDRTRYASVGAVLQQAFTRLAKASPNAVILAVPWVGRPLDRAHALLENDTAATTAEGTGPCSLLTPSGKVDRGGVRTLTRVVAGYDLALRHACDAVHQCVYVDAAARYVDHARFLARDWNHLNPAGHARLAALLWPSVQSALHLG